MVGRINPGKGHGLFLDAVGLVFATVPEASFVVVGGAPSAYENLKQELLARIGALNSSRIGYLDHLSRRDYVEFLDSVDVVVMPSTRPEAGGLVALEAMAMSKAVIAARHGGPLDFMIDGHNGLLVDPNPRELADAITRLCRDSDLRHRLGLAARATVVEKYSLNQHVTEMVQAYERALLRTHR
jgi:glycosyltransferase involved in cell wall biosynthesis